MVNPEHATFGVLMMVNLGLGLYFSLKKQIRTSTTADEVFLGGHTLKVLPLGLSMVASLISGIAVIGFPAHFYAYGFHYFWCQLSVPTLVPLVGLIIIPLLKKLQITSVFEVSFLINTISPPPCQKKKNVFRINFQS